MAPFLLGGQAMGTGGRTTNALLAASLALLVLCGLPPACSGQARLRKPLASALSSVGLSQPQWRLFAPNVHKTNSYVVADVELADGTARQWASPEFGERTLFDRFAQGQLPKLYDNLRLDRNQAAWRPFAEWVARQVAPGEAVRSVRLTRRFHEIPPPAPHGRPLPARGDYQAHVFYERRF